MKTLFTLIVTALRLAAAAGCFFYGYRTIVAAGSEISSIMDLFFGVGAFLIGGILAVPVVIRLLTNPVGTFYYPTERIHRPMPRYGPPAAKAQRGAFEESMKEYERMTKDHPTEIKPYIEMMNIAVRYMKDPARARSVYRRGMARLTKQKDRDTLKRMYDAISTRSIEPKWVQKQRGRRLSLTKYRRGKTKT
jgi:hypothetical protein